MKFELFIFGLTVFFIADVYYDGKYVRLIKTWKKYYQMAGIGFIGLSAYLFIKKYPMHSTSLLKHANGMIKYMPIDKNASDILTPLIDMTRMTDISLFNGSNTNTISGNISEGYANSLEYKNLTPQQKRILTSGVSSGNNNNYQQNIQKNKATKRSVSETKKKYVAARQGWKCGDCKNQLSAWFEVDHTIRLEDGGSNHVDNLIALCRECHGKKTAFENL